MNLKYISAGILVVLLAVPLFSQEETNLEFILGGGLSVPVQPDNFSSDWKRGYTIGGGFGYRLNVFTSIDIYFDYYNFSFDPHGFMERTELMDRLIRGNPNSIIAITANLTYTYIIAPNYVAPYISGGAGYQSFTNSEVRAIQADSEGLIEDEAVFPGGKGGGALGIVSAGILIPSRHNRNFFVEVRYGFAFTDMMNPQFIPIRFGFRQQL